MQRSNDALLNDALNDVAYLLSDVGKLRGLPEESLKRKGFAVFSKRFCDSIIFWGLYNSTKEETKGTTIGKYIAELREVFNQYDLDVDSIKLTHCGRLDVDDEYFPTKILKRHRRECNDTSYQAKYMAIKVSLNYCRAKTVVPMLANMVPLLADMCLVLHDVDFARDCRYVTTRWILQRHIHDNDAAEIVDDRRKVGDHCVSWRGTTEETKNIRYKVYNKFIQVLESADARKSLGSRMEALVANEGTFARRLERHKNHGYSRVELTFYGLMLLSLGEYNDPSVAESGRATLVEETVYERVPGCTAITAIAGAGKGMFPSRDAIDGGAREFSKVGIVEVDWMAQTKAA
ncbi:hypothetical protein BGX28_000637 [Mortierella sp. GBA30]|nr:hypothetical protein BGX28_000637 [Mortierella sp. GBA30]